MNRKFLKKEDASTEEIKKATEALSTEAQEIGKIIYAEAQKKGQEGKEGQDKGEGDVVEGEVVDEEKK